MGTRKYIVIYFLLVSLSGFSQFRIWQLTAHSGEATLRGNYMESITKTNDFSSKQSSAFLNGFFSLRTNSFFVHPNFMDVSLNATYSPMTSREYYINAPDYSGKSNMEAVNFSAIFFKRRSTHLSANAGISNSIMNVENITRVRSNSKQFVANLVLPNKILPLLFSYTLAKTEQKTMGFDDAFTTQDQIFNATVSKSFTSHDNSTLTFMNTKTSSIQNLKDLAPIHSSVSDNLLSFNNVLFLDRENKYTLTSSASSMFRKGSFLYNNLSGNENLTLQLPKRFDLTSYYGWGFIKQNTTRITNQSYQSFLNHKLYNSLNSRLSFTHNQTDQAEYKQQSDKLGISLNYSKRIPKGILTLSYNHYKDYQRVKTPPSLLATLREGYKLTDNQIVLFKNQNINTQSVVVRDSTGTIIYQLNTDYILIDHSPYLEILRIPGGMIKNGATVYVDYNSMQAGLYKFNGQSNVFFANVFLFKNVLNAYYNFFTQDYSNKNNTENLVLNYYTTHAVGIKIDFNFIRGGVEYQNSRSNILPIKALIYYIIVKYNKTYKKFSVNLNGDIHGTQTVKVGGSRQHYTASSLLSYRILRNVNLNLGYKYIKISGVGVNVNVHATNFMVSSGFRQLSISLGSQLNWAKNSNSTNSNYKGVFIQVTRVF